MFEKILKKPIILSIAFGVAGVIFTVGVFFILYVFLMILDTSSHNSSAGGVLGFVVVPIFLFAAAPWSFGIIDLSFPYNILIGIFINSSVTGFLIGTVFYIANIFKK